MSEGVRVIGPDRTQLRWDMVDLDSQLPDDHRARLVSAFVEGLDLSEFYDRIKARDAVAGRPWASWGPPRESAVSYRGSPRRFSGRSGAGCRRRHPRVGEGSARP
jgi:hypothetical protein